MFETIHHRKGDQTMPYIDITLSKKLTDTEKDVLKTNLGSLITLIPEKTEKVLMIGIKDDCTMYFSGEKKQVAYLSINLFTKADFVYKNELTKKICEMLEREFSITTDNVFLTFQEYETWGANGQLMQG